MSAIDRTVPRFATLPPRKSTPQGADLVWWAARRVMKIATDKRTPRNYRVRELDGIARAEFAGRAFAIDKQDEGTDPEATGYTLLVSDRGPAHDCCECKGYLRHGHCAHLDAMRVVLASDWWDLPKHPCDTPEYAEFLALHDAAYPVTDQPEPNPETVQ